MEKSTIRGIAFIAVIILASVTFIPMVILAFDAFIEGEDSCLFKMYNAI